MSDRIRGTQVLCAGALSLVVALLTAAAFVTPVAAQDAVRAIYLPMVSTESKSDPQPEPEPEPEPQPGAPSSESLIESARQAGTINAETALLYRVFAGFGDPRLPAEFRGNDTKRLPTLALREAKAKMALLSPATQAALAPFLQPPMSPTSWLELEAAGSQQAAVSQGAPQGENATNKIVWLTACKTDPEIKVWYQDRYPEDADDAANLCELVRGIIWPRLKALFGRTPPDDSAQNNNGGDGQFDIYLVKAKTLTVEYGGCFDTPSYMLVDNRGWTEAEITVAVMSAFLNGFKGADCMEYLWLYAASRTWAIDYVAFDDNWEQTFADDFLNHTDLSLNSYPLVPVGPDREIGDGAYLWLWFVTNWVSDAKTVMPAIWENAANPDSLEVVNGAIPGGFAQNWARFSELNWNTDPVDLYMETDLLLHSTKPKLDVDVALNGTSAGTFELDGKVNYLAAHTYHFNFSDPSVRSVLYINPFHNVDGNAHPTARVNAIYRMADGSWVLEDWTQKYSKTFCRDVADERIAELTLIISNNEWKDRSHKLAPAYPPRLNFTNIGCRGWEVEATATITFQGEGGSFTESTNVNATYLYAKMGDDSNSHPFAMYNVAAGSGNWKHKGANSQCSSDDSGTFALTGGIYTSLFVFNNATDHQSGTLYTPDDRGYNGFGTEGPPIMNTLTTTYICPDGSHEQMVFSAQRWFMQEQLVQGVSADGTQITGSNTTVDDTAGTITTTYEWTMKALPPE
jgi:hypothetical protein